MSERDDYTNYCNRCLTGTGVHTCGEGKPDSEPKPKHKVGCRAGIGGNKCICKFLHGAVERVQPEPAKFEVGKTYPANVNGEPGSVTFFSQDAADAYSKQLKGEPVPSTSVEPNLVKCGKCGEMWDDQTQSLACPHPVKTPVNSSCTKHGGINQYCSMCLAETAEKIAIGARTSVEPQVEPSRVMDMLKNLLAVVHRDGGHYTDQHGLKKSTEDAMRLTSERLADSQCISPVCGNPAKVCLDCANGFKFKQEADGVLAIRRDSVSHPPLEQEAREWLRSPQTFDMRWRNSHPDARMSREDQEVALLAAFVRERSKRA